MGKFKSVKVKQFENTGKFKSVKVQYSENTEKFKSVKVFFLRIREHVRRFKGVNQRKKRFKGIDFFNLVCKRLLKKKDYSGTFKRKKKHLDFFKSKYTYLSYLSIFEIFSKLNTYSLSDQVGFE